MRLFMFVIFLSNNKWRLFRILGGAVNRTNLPSQTRPYPCHTYIHPSLIKVLVRYGTWWRKQLGIPAVGHPRPPLVSEIHSGR